MVFFPLEKEIKSRARIIDKAPAILNQNDVRRYGLY